MSTGEARTNGYAGQAPMAMPNPAQEVYEQLLALADRVGAAYAEAYQEIGAAYTEAFQKTAVTVGSLQGTLADGQSPDWAGLLSPTAHGDALTAAKERVETVRESLSEMGRMCGLAYLDAGEKATLAIVKAHEQIGTASPVDAVKDTAAKRAEVARKVTKASAGTMRQLAG